MKTFKLFTIALTVVLFSLSSAFAQDAEKLDKVAIKTFFHCPNGKALIEKEIAKVDGVKAVIANFETKVVTVKFDTNKLSKESINEALEAVGYKTELTKEGAKIKKACDHGKEGHKDHEGEHHEHDGEHK